MSTTNGDSNVEQLQPTTQLLNDDRTQEFIELKEAFGHLARQQSTDHNSNKQQFRSIEEKLELWIRTNQSLMEGQQENAKSNHRLVEAILANTSEMQKTTQEQQRSATSFEKGTNLLGELENRLKALETQTKGFKTATTELNGILKSWKPLLEKTQTLGEILVNLIPQMNQSSSNQQNQSSPKVPKLLSPSQELNASLRQNNQSDQNNQNSESNSSPTNNQTLNPFEIKRWIGITRRDLLWTGRGNLGWSIFSTLVLIGLISAFFWSGSSQLNNLSANTNSALKILQRVEKNIR
jgi:uncharacterized coiled-coil protein SlyX